MRAGYARVSTDGQSVDTQLRLLQQAGCDRVFHETASGAKSTRAQLRRCLSSLKAGDVLCVVRLDRLARSTRDLLNIIAEVIERKAEFKIPERHLGRYHHPSRTADVDCTRWPS